MNKLLRDIEEQIRYNVGERIQRYYMGEPIIIPRVDMPCVILDVDNIENEYADTQRHYQRSIVTVSVVTPILDLIDENNPQITPGKELLMDIIQGEDDNGNPRSGTILEAILKVVNYNTKTKLTGNVTVQYGIRGIDTPPRDNALITQEAQIRIPTTGLIVTRLT